jgi:hypothetical protein
MPYYVQIQTTSYGNLTAKCGTKAIADRLSNTSSVAGDDFAYAYKYEFSVRQPHNEAGAATSSSAPFQNELVLLLPDYEPMSSCALNTINGHDVIKQLTLNITGRRNGQETLLNQYIMSDGILVSKKHEVKDQRDTDAQAHRGEIELTFKFQKVQINDSVANTQGTLETVAGS